MRAESVCNYCGSKINTRYCRLNEETICENCCLECAIDDVRLIGEVCPEYLEKINETGRIVEIEQIQRPWITTPNMPNYDEAYSTFSWDDALKELEFFEDGKINAAYNIIDKHKKTSTWTKIALIWEDEEGNTKKYTFEELAKLSNRFANVLVKLGVSVGDRVFIFLPRIPELYISFLGIVKTGAIAGTLFSAFGPAAIKDRLEDSEAKILITNSELVKRVYEIQGELPKLQNIIIVDEKELRDNEVSFAEEIKNASESFEPAHLDLDDHYFMLYTSGTTGKPKGVVHRQKALLQQMITARFILELKEDDIYWCTADPGWVTGISYGIAGPWTNGVTELIYGGRFDPKCWYELIEKHRITIWYTAPTAIRMLMSQDDELPKQFDLSSLRHILSVGEPLNPAGVIWGLEVLGKPFYDTWWQTETGSIIIANYPSMPIKPGSMGKPFPGIIAGIVDDKGNELPNGVEGNLAIRPDWPAMMKEIYKKPEKYKSYFVNGWYISGDIAKRDEDGYFWFVSRADDVIKTAGERVGPFEVESALVEHRAVAEAGVIGKPDPLRGEIIKAFIVLHSDYEESEELLEDIKNFVKKRLAGHAYPREIEVKESLPKTRSGKIMRRLLKAIELGQPTGDTSTVVWERE
ncbi:MAG: acetate--CoA ligase [Candidatus Jordarchaeum sp.]|uniref:acetate--CoA ligase n=1 Tax=Candidatus Jordarchaeum sp. TaxID=2823881 RepID=UPI00404A99A5